MSVWVAIASATAADQLIRFQGGYTTSAGHTSGRDSENLHGCDSSDQSTRHTDNSLSRLCYLQSRSHGLTIPLQGSDTLKSRLASPLKDLFVMRRAVHLILRRSADMVARDSCGSSSCKRLCMQAGRLDADQVCHCNDRHVCRENKERGRLYKWLAAYFWCSLYVWPSVRAVPYLLAHRNVNANITLTNFRHKFD